MFISSTNLTVHECCCSILTMKTTLDANTFAVVLTSDERALIDGTIVRVRKNRVSSRDFKSLAGHRSYKSQRGDWRTFA